MFAGWKNKNKNNNNNKEKEVRRFPSSSGRGHCGDSHAMVVIFNPYIPPASLAFLRNLLLEVAYGEKVPSPQTASQSSSPGAGRSGCPCTLSPHPAHRDGEPQGGEGVRVPLAPPRQVKLPPLDWELSKISQLQVPSSLPRTAFHSLSLSQPGSSTHSTFSPAVSLGMPRRWVFPSAHSSHHTQSSAFALKQEALRTACCSVTPACFRRGETRR